MALKKLRISVVSLLFVLFQESHHVVSGDSTLPPTSDPTFDVITPFNFSLPKPCNKMGISTSIIVQMEFKAKVNKYLWRTNAGAINEETRDVLQELCDTPRYETFLDEKGGYLNWGNCTFSDNQITAILEQPNEDFWDKNITYSVIITKPFVARREGVKSVCILDEFPHRKAYAVLLTHVFPDGDEPIYKLDAFLPMARTFFQDIIDIDKILQYLPQDFMHQTPHYKCMLGILSGEDVDSLKKNCKVKCQPKKDIEKGRDPQKDEL